MRKFFQRPYDPRKIDFLFAVMAAVTALTIMLPGGDARTASAAIDHGWVQSLVLIGAALVATLLASKLANIDQRLADDFVYQTLAKSALVALASTVVLAACWRLTASIGFAAISGDQLLNVMLLIWPTAYFVTRWRGTRA